MLPRVYYQSYVTDLAPADPSGRLVPPPVYTFSASQIATYQECPRKWAFQYIDKLPRPQNASAAFGTAVHALLEKYLRDGATPDYSTAHGYVAASGLEHLPAPNTVRAPAAPLSIESRFSFVSPRGHTFTGFRDWVEFTIIPTVGDHKTTSDLKWAKSEEELADNTQGVIYAYVTLEETKAPAVNLKWVYYQTRGPRKSHVVRICMTQPEVSSKFDKIDLLATEISDIVKRKVPSKSLPPNPSACEMYGGCPYRHICNLSPQERLSGIMTQGTTSNLLASLARRAETAAPTATPPAAATPPPTAPAAATPNPVVGPEVNPPGEALPESAAAALESKPSVPVAATEAPTAKARRGRPPGSKNTAKAAGPTPAARAESEATSAGPGAGYTLYVDCMPMGMSDITFAEDIFADVRRDVFAATATPETPGLADFRFAEYGRGPGIFAGALRMRLEAGELSGHVIVDSRTPEGTVSLQAFIEHAALVIRGLR